jgi:hypothetical protein
MRLKYAGIALALGALALTLLGCEAPAPLPPPPPPPVVLPPPPPRVGPFYFVNVSSLALRDGPTTAAPQISTLRFNDEVELLDTTDGWARVRDVERNIIGWASMRYLQPVPASRPRPVPSRRPPPPKEEAPAKPPEAPAKPPEAPAPEAPAPKAM